MVIANMILKLNDMHMKFKIVFFFLLAGTLGNEAWAQSGASLKLIYPSNGQTVQESFPTFSWTPPADVSVFYTYDIRIVEVLDHQTAEAAIMANPDWYSEKKIALTSLLYLPTAPLLLSDKKYAWQVTAHGSQQFNESTVRRALVSDVFLFQPGSTEVKVCTITPVKAPANKSFFMLEGPVMRFTFPGENEEESANGWIYSITDKHDNLVIGNKSIKPEFIERGNYYQLALNQYSFFRKKENRQKVFNLEATDKRGEKYVLRFMLQ